MLESIAHFVQQLIIDLGYPGLFLLVVLESTMVPVPSALVFPYAGFLAERGDFHLGVVLAVISLGAMTGSLLSYWIGSSGGNPLLEKYGKYMFVKHADLERTHEFFEKYGAWTVFFARFVPVVRHMISLAAGIARMPLRRFAIQTLLGATIWGWFLTFLGYFLGAKWESVAKVIKRFDLLFAVLIVLAVVVVVVRFIRKRRAARDAALATSTAEER